MIKVMLRLNSTFVIFLIFDYLFFHKFIIAISSFVAQAPDAKGTHFIIGFMENYQSTIPVELFVTTMRTTRVSVRITAPKLLSAGLNTAFTVTSGEVKHITVNKLIRCSGNEMAMKGIELKASDEIKVYGINKERYSTDGFLALPVDILGTEYYSMSYKPAYPSHERSQILIVGVEDRTRVSIRLSAALGVHKVYWNRRNYRGGQSFYVNIHKYNTFHFYSSGDLTGTFIKSNKPVAVFSGNKCARILNGACDHIVEMLTPVKTWGKEFITVPIPDRRIGDVFRVMSMEDNTKVTVKGGLYSQFTLSRRGQFKQLQIPSTAFCHFKSDKAVLLTQFVRGQASNDNGDPSMSIVQPVSGYSSTFTFTTPKRPAGLAKYRSYFAFVVKDRQKSGMRIDRKTVSTTFHRIAGTEYVGGYIRVSEGAHTVHHASPIVVFGGYLYGTGNWETYAFPIGMRLASVNAVRSNLLTNK